MPQLPRYGGVGVFVWFACRRRVRVVGGLPSLVRDLLVACLRVVWSGRVPCLCYVWPRGDGQASMFAGKKSRVDVVRVGKLADVILPWTRVFPIFVGSFSWPPTSLSFARASTSNCVLHVRLPAATRGIRCTSMTFAYAESRPPLDRVPSHARTRRILFCAPE